MSSARFGCKWADVDEDDEDEGGMDVGGKSTGTRFETPVDEHGVKTVSKYTERDGKTYKVTKKVKKTQITTWTNQAIQARKNMPKFGKAATYATAAEQQLVVRSTEEVLIELTKKINVQAAAKDDADDKFYEESLDIAESLTKEKKVWSDMRNERRGLDEVLVGVGAGPSVRDTMNEGNEDGGKSGAAGGAGQATSKYVPPSLRGAMEKGGGKGDGKGGKVDHAAQQETSLRVTNLSEDCREGDLQDLFGQFGRLQRVYLAKDQDTFQSRGFAFITYYTKEDAQRAIDKLHGHGYDNLILSVQFAKPRA